MFTRESWQQLPLAQRDQALLQFAWMMLGDNITLIPRRGFTPSHMARAHELVNQTSARVYSWLSSMLGLASVVFAVAIIFFSQLAWTVRLVLLVGVILAVFVASRWLFARSLVKAAYASPDAFLELWENGAIRVEVRGEQYNLAEPNRWQDIVLLAAGWRDLIERVPVTQGEQLAEALR